MRVVMFTHSILSDWNHGNAHFQRGIAKALLNSGIEVKILEPADSWSRLNLVREHGEGPLLEFREAYPDLPSAIYEPDSLNLDQALEGANLVLVHEWTDHTLVARIGRHRSSAKAPYMLLFHDTHHRTVTAPHEMLGLDLSQYDGVLAYGSEIRDFYRGWLGENRAWTWHEAADITHFYPRSVPPEKEGDVVWIGNWGDDERVEEIREYFIRPVLELGLRATVYGVRYPAYALEELKEAGITYRGWLPNFKVPEVYARYRATLHIPRKPYASVLPGIPTIRPFEALSCDIPLLSAPWNDSENLFRVGTDFLMAQSGEEMSRHLLTVLWDPMRARQLARAGLQTIRKRHTCMHRVLELLDLYNGWRKNTLLNSQETNQHENRLLRI